MTNTLKFHDPAADVAEVWPALAAPLPPSAINWRIDSKPTQRDGKYVARFVPYVDAHLVRERLDEAAAGAWDLTFELLPGLGGDGGEVESDARCAFKARLTVFGVIREDVGTGPDYKQAATDAFKRAAVRFGVAHELYAYEPNWVQVDGDSKYAKAVEDPQLAYTRRYGHPATDRGQQAAVEREALPRVTGGSDLDPDNELNAPQTVLPNCPKCDGKMWDNRLSKRNPKAPDFKCRDRTCDGVIWPPKPAANGATRGGDDEDFNPFADDAP